MSEELEILEQYQLSAGTYFSDRCQYTDVTVAFLYWDHVDLNIEGEVKRLRKVLEIGYGYHVLPDFIIPLDASAQQELGSYLATFVREWSNKANTLVIVYYAGHCYYTKDGRDARWFARKDSDYSLSWTTCGHCLFGAIGDVLIILDCCEAAVKLTGTKQLGRIELLAATAKGLPTPVPGKLSFTSFLIAELVKRKSEGVTARELSSFIWRRDEVTQTPYWEDLALKRLESIMLFPLNEIPRVSAIQQDADSGVTLLSVSHNGQLTGYQLAEYLKTGLPTTVTAVNIEALILRAKTLQDDSQLRVFPKDSLLSNLSESSKRDILCQVQRLDTAMQKSSNDAKTSAEEQRSDTAKENLRSIHNAITAVNTAIETPLLLGRDKNEILQAFRTPSVSTKPVSEMVALRQFLDTSAADPPAEDLEIPRENLQFKVVDGQRFCCGKLGGAGTEVGRELGRETDVLLEFLSYEPDHATSEPSFAVVQQTKRIAQLLHLRKRIEFRILPCAGYFHDKVRHRFGFVFEQHHRARIMDLPIALSDIYKDPQYRFTSLDDRLRLAYTLALAVDHFHRIGWVHKELRSNNILMLKMSRTVEGNSPPDAKPGVSITHNLHDLSLWIFGFGYSRIVDGSTALEEDHHAENNMYRHPQRVGRPQKRFTRAYDVYALGVVLFEIAMWKKIKPAASDARVRSDDVYEYIMRPQQRIELAFRSGSALLNAIVACLDFDRLTDGMSELEEHTYFQQRVVEVLRKASEGLPGGV